MEVSFDKKELRDVCTNSDVAESNLPLAVARSLRTVIADLRATRFLDEFVLLHSIDHTGAEFRIDLGERYSIIFASAHRITPMTGGDFDLQKIYRVRVLTIERESDD